MPADVHVHDARSLIEDVVMQRCDVDATLLQLQHDGLDFAFDEDQISHGHGIVSTSVKGRPRAKCESCFDRCPCHGDVQIFAGHGELECAVRLEFTATSECALDGFPTGGFLLPPNGERQQSNSDEFQECTFE